MLFILLLSMLLTNVFGYYLKDLTLPLNPQKELEITFEKCVSTKKILYKGRCWDLLPKGPCNEGKYHYTFYYYADGRYIIYTYNINYNIYATHHGVIYTV